MEGCRCGGRQNCCYNRMTPDWSANTLPRKGPIRLYFLRRLTHLSNCDSMQMHCCVNRKQRKMASTVDDMFRGAAAAEESRTPAIFHVPKWIGGIAPQVMEAGHYLPRCFSAASGRLCHLLRKAPHRSSPIFPHCLFSSSPRLAKHHIEPYPYYFHVCQHSRVSKRRLLSSASTPARSPVREPTQDFHANKDFSEGIHDKQRSVGTNKVVEKGKHPDRKKQNQNMHRSYFCHCSSTAAQLGLGQREESLAGGCDFGSVRSSSP
ncbi:unnamed protein product [Pleuronectes platessa]|uniref:Uncharacterized protein n=1 Tax=Pleuronectes platessa TaxID=8262 RepID=A0A9N7VMZ0_PLEPL|nr:unnamed protein product [Pleuronectes platessa]